MQLTESGGLKKPRKPVSKGTLASIQEGEKLDLFLARGCGELSVELCQGVYGKELFHSIKRAGHHAKRALILMKCARLGAESPRLEDLKLIALVPGEGDRPNFQFPRIWDLQDPTGYYQSIVVPRQERALNRMLHRQLHDMSARGKKDAVRKTAGPDSLEEVPPSDPAGKRLAPAEVKRSVSHAPHRSQKRSSRFVGMRLVTVAASRTLALAAMSPSHL